MPPYHDEPVYIDALAASIEKHLATLAFKPEVIVASYPRHSEDLFQNAATRIIATA